MRDINEIIVHCTATPEGRPVSVATVRKWHKANGWSDIGYHYLIDLDEVMAGVCPLSDTYNRASALADAIDDLTEDLTGDRERFCEKGHN